jgi:2-polyprenyl-6-hydroxyphenyl methylase/3-demethylubiquinone-9 3-methyltransferase
MVKAKLGGASPQLADSGEHAGKPATTALTSHRPNYGQRKLAEGYPDIERLGAEHFAEHQGESNDVLKTMQRIGRLIDLGENPSVLVIGCGPKPQSIRELLDAGFSATGVEPVGFHVETAAGWLGSSGIVLQGTAEALPARDDSQDAVIMESVLEHVDSAHKSVAEAYRVLRPGGVLYLTTTNRTRFSPTGQNGEFFVPFFNWMPAIVRESYIFRHLHYEPSLAAYTPRPAVHWFSYPDLCALGRQAGFAAFYSFLDLIDETADESVASSRAKSWIVRNVRQHPWFRALMLSQMTGNPIFMYKRDDAVPPRAD